jgi:hypothetical protein
MRASCTRCTVAASSSFLLAAAAAMACCSSTERLDVLLGIVDKMVEAKDGDGDGWR